MKDLIKKALRYSILFIHNLSSSIKVFFINLFNTLAGFFGSKKKSVNTKKLKVSQKSSPAKTVTSTYKVSSQSSNPDKKIWWKNKLVWGGTALIIIAAIVVPIIASSAKNNPEQAALAQSGTENNDRTDDAVDVASQSDDLNAYENNQNVETSIDAATTQIPTATPMHTPIATTEPVDENLAPGVHDSRILTIQQRLMELGYLDWDEPTDYYGYGTEYALQLFQRKHNLQVDGIAGVSTLDKLFADDAAPYTVKLGDSGTDVQSIQKRLQALKYLKAGSTGYFGTDTETAVKSFQKRNGLYADGNVGEQTREALFSESARAAATTSSGGSSSGGSSSGGSSGNQPVVVGNPDDASASALIAFAQTQLGKPYVRGGKGPNSFDCSGYVYYCLNSIGFKINYMTSTAWRSANFPTINNFTDVQKGDILCFNGHVGMYMGDGKMIDASSGNGKTVIRTNIFSSSYWKSNFRCAKRVF